MFVIGDVIDLRLRMELGEYKFNPAIELIASEDVKAERAALEYFEPSELEINGLPKHVGYGYATTIHKSQGGEYQHVIAIVPKNLSYTFGKPGLYTAVTRARQTLTIIGALEGR